MERGVSLLQSLPHGLVDGDDAVHVPEAEALLASGEGTHPRRQLPLRDRCEQLGGRVVDVEDDFGPGELRDESREHEEVGHVVDVDEVVGRRGWRRELTRPSAQTKKAPYSTRIAGGRPLAPDAEAEHPQRAAVRVGLHAVEREAEDVDLVAPAH